MSKQISVESPGQADTLSPRNNVALLVPTPDQIAAGMEELCSVCCPTDPLASVSPADLAAVYIAMRELEPRSV